MTKIVVTSLCWCINPATSVLLLILLLDGSILYASDEPKYTLLAASSTYHLYPSGHHTQYFDNELIVVKRTVRHFEPIDGITLGTLKNSNDKRCLMLGVNRDWQNINANTKLIGLYAYVGDFFLGDFDECSDEGIYEDFKSVVGIGFAPYVYHGVKYELNQDLNFNAGLILPGVISLSLGYHF